MLDLLDAHQAADYLRVHRQTVSRWVSRGLLRPALGKGKGHGKQLFNHEELDRFIREEGEKQWWR